GWNRPPRVVGMVMLAVALLVLDPRPISLESITVERARALDGKLVAASFVVTKPSYTLLGCTVLGAADRDDGAERGAVLKGNRLDIPGGKRVTVIGVVRVIDHPPGVVDRAFVPGW